MEKHKTGGFRGEFDVRSRGIWLTCSALRCSVRKSADLGHLGAEFAAKWWQCVRVGDEIVAVLQDFFMQMFWSTMKFKITLSLMTSSDTRLEVMKWLKRWFGQDSLWISMKFMEQNLVLFIPQWRHFKTPVAFFTVVGLKRENLEFVLYWQKLFDRLLTGWQVPYCLGRPHGWKCEAAGSGPHVASACGLSVSPHYSKDRKWVECHFKFIPNSCCCLLDESTTKVRKRPMSRGVIKH